jgi:L-alanine-DL-glutamate epimerase-like enolase superfamily enzyme
MISHHQLPLDPPLRASWDPHPRTSFPATIVRVFDDAGRMGVGSGDSMYGFADYEHLFIGEDPLDVERHHAVLSNIDFHAGRPWPFEVALWDLAGKINGTPTWKLLGGSGDAVRAYASTAVHRTPHEMVDVARRVVERGFGAMKVRFGRPAIDDDFAVVRGIRDAVGDTLELMVDCNQGWAMPWDRRRPWDVRQALEVARALEPEQVYWLEEPLHRGDYDGYSELRRNCGVRIAGGEMTREPYEFRELLRRDCIDVFQPDCVCTMGIGGVRDLAAEVAAAGKIFSPHTWGNGIALMANLHVVAGTVGTPFIEYPFDPPDWTPSRRDFMLTEPVEPDDDGWLHPGDAPGLGIELDEAMLERTLSGSATFD